MAAPVLETLRYAAAFTDDDDTRLNDYSADTDQHGTGLYEANLTWEVDGNAAHGFGSASTTIRWLVLHETQQADVQVEVDIAGNGNNGGGSGIWIRSPSDDSGILVQLFYSAGSVNVETWTGGSKASDDAAYSVTLDENSTHTLTVQAAGNDITVWLDDVELGTVSNSTYNTATRHGLRTRTTAHRFDDLAIYHDATITNAIALTSPVPWQVIQNDGGTALLTVSGTKFGGSAVEWRLNQVGSEAWATLDATTDATTFDEQVEVSYGDSGTLEVRLAADTGTTDSAANVGCGDVIIIYGQSNASGKGTNNQSYGGSEQVSRFGEDRTWAEAADPMDTDLSSPSGSPWLRFAELWTAITEAPLAFVTAPDGSKRIDELSAGSSYNDLVATYAAATTGGAVGMVFWQGEADIVAMTAEATYKSGLVTLVGNVRTGLGLAELPIIVLETGNVGTGTFADEDERTAAHTAIRRAQAEVCEENAGVIRGPSFYDVDLSGGDDLHFTTDGNLTTVANRTFFVAWHEWLGNATPGQGPVLINVTRQASTITDLTFNATVADDGTWSTSAFHVLDSGDSVLAVSAVTRPSSNVLRLTHATAPDTYVRVSLGLGRTCEGLTVPRHASFAQPAQPFYDEATRILVVETPQVFVLAGPGESFEKTLTETPQVFAFTDIGEAVTHDVAETPQVFAFVDVAEVISHEITETPQTFAFVDLIGNASPLGEIVVVESPQVFALIDLSEVTEKRVAESPQAFTCVDVLETNAHELDEAAQAFALADLAGVVVHDVAEEPQVFAFVDLIGEGIVVPPQATWAGFGVSATYAGDALVGVTYSGRTETEPRT